MLMKPENTDWTYKDDFQGTGIAGYNYGETSYEKHHEWYPDRIVVGTETNLMNMKERIEMVRNQPYIIGEFYMDRMGISGRMWRGSD